ncbi:hypothetical protein TNCV_4636351 [Trichonephila clavipes]|uniref:Uncharacterized protein n=1 Tax=Trichonephila clavipes TaxID=2585209 RepID=A0A8X6R9S4_TRICX|nr:hypothetical protein TNCV_4636351 [Trichonephila clavipes]
MATDLTAIEVIYSQFGLAIHPERCLIIKQGVDSSNGPKTRLPLFPIFISEFCLLDEAHFWLNGYVNKTKAHFGVKLIYKCMSGKHRYIQEKLTVWSAFYGLVESFFKNE